MQLLGNFQPTSYSLTFAAKWIQSPVNYSERDSGGGGNTKGHSKRLSEKCQPLSMGAYLTQQDSDVTGNKGTSVLWFKEYTDTHTVGYGRFEMNNRSVFSHTMLSE